MDTKKYERKPFYIDAVQVTDENIQEVAEWCHGLLHHIDGDDPKSLFIKVDVKNPLSSRQTQAFAGDWVLSSKSGFKVYTDRAFKANFIPAKDSAVAEAEDDSE